MVNLVAGNWASGFLSTLENSTHGSVLPQARSSKLETRKQYAQFYATEFGVPVLPLTYPVDGKCSCGNADCSSPGKHPIQNLAPHGVQNATTDPDVIGQWFDKYPDANIGVATGAASGIFAVDVDVKSGGLETWADWQDINRTVNTLTSLTGSGGNHYWFKTDGQEFKNSASKVGPGIDIRGEGGYIVAPPSMHISGNAYEFEVLPMSGTIASAPAWLLAKLRDVGKPSIDGIPTPSTVEVKEGQRNDHLARLGGAARQKGASEAGVSALLLAENGNLDSPLPEGEVAKVAQSISSYEPSAGPLPEPLALTYVDAADFDVVTTHQLAGGELVIGAREIRKEKTGVHAVVEVRHGAGLLGFNTFNLGRSHDRHELSRRCHERLPEVLRALVAKETLAMYIDEFCLQAYPTYLNDLTPSLLHGDPDIPITMICGDYIIEGGGTIMFAPPGRGKSYTAISMAISVDAGNHKLWNVKQSKVLYVNLERSAASIQRRIGMCNIALGEENHRPLHVFNTRGKSLAALSDVLRRYIQNEGIEVVFLDSISRSGQGSLIGDEETNRTIDLMNDISPTWLAVGHTPRADSTHVFGSVHFEAGADLMVSLTSDTDDNLMGVGLKVEKSNDTPKRPREKFVFEFGPNGLIAAREAKPGEFSDMDAAPTIASQLVDYILENGGKTDATGAAGELNISRSEVSRALNKSNQFVKLEKEGKSQFFGVKASANS